MTKVTVSAHQIKRTMRKLVSDNGDMYKDNLTALAEDAAYDLDHPDWLDDPDHMVWDCAMDIARDLDLGL